MRKFVCSTTALIAMTALQAGAVAHAEPSSSSSTVASRIALHLDISRGQQPENVAMAPSGTAYVTFASARQVATITKNRRIRILATMPAPADGGASTPALGFALTTGIVRSSDGTLHFLYASGDAASTGLYTLRPHSKKPRLISRLPATGLPNGLAQDPASKKFYVTDSVLGKIYTIGRNGGRARVWSADPTLAASGFLGANGIKIHRGAVWASNLDQGTVVRIPIRKDRAGTSHIEAEGLVGIDDFEFTGHRDQIVAALNPTNEVALIASNGRSRTILSADDGLQGPTSVAIRHGRAYVFSAAYLTQTDPNLVIARLPRTH